MIAFMVWGHHMFVVGQSPLADLVFSFLSFIVAVPSAIKVFNWTATLYRGQITFEAPMLYARSTRQRQKPQDTAAGRSSDDSRPAIVLARVCPIVPMVRGNIDRAFFSMSASSANPAGRGPARTNGFAPQVEDAISGTPCRTCLASKVRLRQSRTDVLAARMFGTAARCSGPSPRNHRKPGQFPSGGDLRPPPRL
jgi:hypothetical protein